MIWLQTVLEVIRDMFMLLVVIAICCASLFLIGDLVLSCREAML